MGRGYFGIGVYKPKNGENIGTLWRSANVFGASFIFIIGARFKKQPTDTLRTERHIPLYQYDTYQDFRNNIPHGCQMVGIECPGKEKLASFKHPVSCLYLLGSEDNGLPQSILDDCQNVVEVEAKRCLNVSVAGSIVMYSRSVGTNDPA